VWPADAEIALVPMGSESAGAASGAWDGHCDAQLGHCFLLSTSDVDGDGRLELLVYEQWANDYGLAVRGDGGKTELYRFSCGNI
jgi:hypothetical protein